MPRFYYQERAVVYAPADVAIGAVVRTLTDIGGRPTVAGGRVTSKLGHWLRTRIIGGVFVQQNWLPIEAVVDVVDLGDHREIVVNVAERIGFGWIIGMEGRLREHCQQTARFVRDSVAYKLATGT